MEDETRIKMKELYRIKNELYIRKVEFENKARTGAIEKNDSVSYRLLSNEFNDVSRELEKLEADEQREAERIAADESIQSISIQRDYPRRRHIGIAVPENSIPT
jgi:hypothetical protein